VAPWRDVRSPSDTSIIVIFDPLHGGLPAAQ
jgi:hypothetical protein